MPYIRIDTNAGEVAQWIDTLARRIPDAVLFTAVNQLADEALELYARTYRSWRHKPAFRKKFEAKRRMAEMTVGTDDQIYTYVDFGTAPHYIVAVDAPMLVYPEVYVPKTQPGVLWSWPAHDAGGLVRRKWVRHPGARARGFTEEIQKRIDRIALPIFRVVVMRWIRGTSLTPLRFFSKTSIIKRFNR